ncbi:hypothetical protein BDQ94DRAFT_162032 [Aspergillus welwitschiae]|uniref:Uncharacterized protein n=1 Tax=Aspergillus welwitschiae TaxID=1341132 RepID=A0A3F3PS25_9EURO|nr:hypothetical protein BDQ94DRAFT_162032 [Aspergillus welwitschiae]RDH29552.1 hypothetical protein BDQ94DRAFT_162032 [Aspergillus welwitschiae]
MKLLHTLVASVLGLAVSVQATDCTEGMMYCQSVLEDIGMATRLLLNLLYYAKYSTLIPQAISASDMSDLGSATGALEIPYGYLFQCGSGGSITVANFCGLGCVNAGAGHNDHCLLP